MTTDTSAKTEPDMALIRHRAEMVRKKFDREADTFVWIMIYGGGMDNIHMLNTIRSLHNLYLETGAYEEVVRAAEGKT